MFVNVGGDRLFHDIARRVDIGQHCGIFNVNNSPAIHISVVSASHAFKLSRITHPRRSSRSKLMVTFIRVGKYYRTVPFAYIRNL